MRVIVVGGGFAGAYAAEKLSRQLPSGWEVLLIDRRNYLLFYPLLVEAGVGNLEPRHIAVPLRKFLSKKGKFLMAEVISADMKAKTLSYQVFPESPVETITFEHLILAPGSVTRFPEMPGLREHAFQLKTLGDSVGMRDRAIQLLEQANGIHDSVLRRELLTIVIVGANFTGVEFAGEYHDLMTEALKQYPNLTEDQLSIYLLEYGERIIPGIDPDLAKFALEHLTRRGMKILTKTSISSIEEHQVTLTTGEIIPTRTVVWCAGIAPSPLLTKIPNLPVNKQGYVATDRDLRVKGIPFVWALGDSATVLDNSEQPYAPTAQNATRQGKVCAANVLAAINGKPGKIFDFNPLGTLAGLGCRNAVAKVFGIKVAGPIAYLLYRMTYLSKMPTLSLKARVLLDWTLDIFFRRSLVQLGIGTPRSIRDLE